VQDTLVLLYWHNGALNSYKRTPESADILNVSIIICFSTGWSSESFQLFILGSITTSLSTNYATYESKCWQPWARQNGEPLRGTYASEFTFFKWLVVSQCGNITYYSLHNTSGGKSQLMSHKWSSICNWLFINMLMPIITVTHNVVFTSWILPIKWLLNFGVSWSQQLPSRSDIWVKYIQRKIMHTRNPQYEH